MQYPMRVNVKIPEPNQVEGCGKPRFIEYSGCLIEIFPPSTQQHYSLAIVHRDDNNKLEEVPINRCTVII